MYISYRSKDEARNEATLDAHLYKSIILQASYNQKSFIEINPDAGEYFLEDKDHPYIEYLNALCENLNGVSWRIIKSDNYHAVILEWGDIELQKVA